MFPSRYGCAVKGCPFKSTNNRREAEVHWAEHKRVYAETGNKQIL